MTDILNLVFKKHSGKLKGTSPGENWFDAGPHGGEYLLYHMMCQFFHDVHALELALLVHFRILFL